MNVPADQVGLPRRYRPDALARRCGEAYGVQINLALGSTRGSKDVWAARQLLMLLLHEQYHWSYCAIGRRVGRDHTTVLWGVKRARARLGEPEHAFIYRWVCGDEEAGAERGVWGRPRAAQNHSTPPSQADRAVAR